MTDPAASKRVTLPDEAGVFDWPGGGGRVSQCDGGWAKDDHGAWVLLYAPRQSHDGLRALAAAPPATEAGRPMGVRGGDDDPDQYADAPASGDVEAAREALLLYLDKTNADAFKVRQRLDAIEAAIRAEAEPDAAHESVYAAWASLLEFEHMDDRCIDVVRRHRPAIEAAIRAEARAAALAPLSAVRVTPERRWRALASRGLWESQ